MKRWMGALLKRDGTTTGQARLFCVLTTGYIVAVVNCLREIIRTSSPLANYTFMLGVLLIPVILLILSRSIAHRWLRFSAYIGISPVLIVSLLVGLLETFTWSDIIEKGIDPSFEPIKALQLKTSKVVVYRTNGGATTSFGIVVRHEKTLLPGIVLVRHIYDCYPGSEAELTVVGPNTIKIVSPPYDPERRPQSDEAVVRLKAWVYL